MVRLNSAVGAISLITFAAISGTPQSVYGFVVVPPKTSHTGAKSFCHGASLPSSGQHYGDSILHCPSVRGFNIPKCHARNAVSRSLSKSSRLSSGAHEAEHGNTMNGRAKRTDHLCKQRGKAGILKSVGAALVWYLASTTMALAVEAAAPLPFSVRRQRRFSLFAPVLYLYVFSNSTIKKRNK